PYGQKADGPFVGAVRDLQAFHGSLCTEVRTKSCLNKWFMLPCSAGLNDALRGKPARLREVDSKHISRLVGTTGCGKGLHERLSLFSGVAIMIRVLESELLLIRKLSRHSRFLELNANFEARQ